MTRRKCMTIVLLCMVAGGCDSGPEPNGQDGPPGAQPEPTNPFFDESVDCAEPKLEPGPQYVRRLTNQEFVNTVGDVLGVDVADLRGRLPRDANVAGFENTATALIASRRHVEQYAEIGSEIATRLDAGWVSAHADCSLGDAACEEAFSRDLGRRLFRRPLTDGELDRFGRLFRVVEAEGDDFERAVRLVVEAMVQSPQFLYRLEASHPNARLPRRVLGIDGFEQTGPRVLQKDVRLAAGRYRVSVQAAGTGGMKPVSLALSLDEVEQERWSVAGSVASPYAANFVIGEEQAGRRTLGLSADGAVNVEQVELVGPLASSFDFSGDDEPEDVRPVTDYEMAARLSYFLWQSAPDEALLQVASRGELRTRAQVRAKARQMLDDARARRAFRRYLDQWLRLDFLDTIERDDDAFPELGRALLDAMKQETYRLFEAVIWEQEADILSVFDADKTWTTAELARLYGLSPAGEGVAEYDLADADERSGLLTHASILALTTAGGRTSPVKRGLYVRTRFMCQQVAPPPGNVDTTPPTPSAEVSKREQFAQHSENPQCAYCHRMMDPIGFGFEHYDAIGAYRTHTPDGHAVDAAGRLGDDEFYGATELGTILRDSDAVESCMVQHVYQYAVGRPPRRSDVCDLREVRRKFTDEGRTFQALVMAVVTSDAFRYVRVHEAGR